MALKSRFDNSDFGIVTIIDTCVKIGVKMSQKLSEPAGTSNTLLNYTSTGAKISTINDPHNPHNI